MDTNTSISIGLFFAAFAFIFGLVAFLRSGKAESKIEGEWRGGVNTNLKLILDGNDEMKAQVKYLTDEMGKMHTRLSVLEDQHNANHRGRNKPAE
jgi:hypothetical protein